MFRAVASLTGLMCFALVTAQLITVGVLVYRGRLDTESAAAVAEVLRGEFREATETAEVASSDRPSAEEVDTARSLHTLELNARADDLLLLKDLLDSEAEQLEKDRASYEQVRNEFERQLEEVRARAIDEATEQTRLIVKAMPTREAVAYLMSISEADGLRLLKGLPERTVAKILQEFAAGADEEQERGQSLFESLSMGRPETDLTDAAKLTLPGSHAPEVEG